MKQVKLTSTLLIMLFINSAKSQKSTIDTVSWDNGNYTLVSELTKVWITETNGRTHKRVTIHTIDTLSGKIEYYFEGTYHDVLISHIEFIAPAKFYDNAIFFLKNKMPVVKTVVLDGDAYNDATFISHIKPKPVIEETVVTNTGVSNPITPLKELSTDGSIIYDKIIFSDGRTLEVKILSIEEGNVHYKRADILSGPVYIISLTISGTLKLAKLTVLTDHKIIDYRN